MSDAAPKDDTGEAPLDPAMERVRRKLVRLLFVSSSVMMLGFAAVIVGVFYRVSQNDAARAPAEPVALQIAPADLRDATVAGDTLVLTIGGNNPRIEVRRLQDGALTHTFELSAP
ncbi:MAG: hypothetical protein AAGF45_02655 [Pseudomonadota bacterium]